MHLLVYRRHFDRHDLVKHLQATLYLCSLGRLIPKSIYELLDPGDLLVLSALSFPKPCEPRIPLNDVGGVIAGIVG